MRRKPFQSNLTELEFEKLSIMAQGNQLTRSAWVAEHINTVWRSIFGEAAPHQTAGWLPQEKYRVQTANGRSRRAAQ